MLKKKLLKSVCAVMCALLTVICMSEPMQTLQNTDSVVYYESESYKESLLQSLNSPLFTASGDVPVTYTSDERLNRTENVTVSLFGVLPVGEVSFEEKENIILIPSGHDVGINIDMQGLLVVGTGEVICDNTGSAIKSPAHEAGISAGDYLIRANGQTLTNTESLENVCRTCRGTITLTVMHSGKTRDVTVTPAFDTRTGTYKLGLWVREDTAGVGTLSYYNPKTQTFGALGHPVTDIDTGDIFTVENGNICECRIIDITPGKSGTPGELTGMFSQNSTVLGNIYKNTEFGIFGSISPASQLSFLYPDGVRLAYPDEVHTGDASIICTLDDNIAREYSCRLVKCKKQDSPAIKGLVVEITDSELINKTGGIVQGMSGSPIIQDGKLAGVVTHVMINNPLRGYGMYAYWMYSVGESRNK